MRRQHYCLTDKGLKRQSNQDSFLVDEKVGLFVVADGVGGHMGGEVASAMAVETLAEFLRNPRIQRASAREALSRGYLESSHRVYDRAIQDSKLTGMGTTMVSIYQRDNRIFIGNAGDSRCYLYRRPYLWQLTEDHSLINEKVRMGIMTEAEAKKTVGKNVITRSVGFERDTQSDILEREVMIGDTYVLCSDGLSGMISDQKMNQILNEHMTEGSRCEKVAQILVEQALAHGGDDNVTVLVLNFSD